MMRMHEQRQKKKKKSLSFFDNIFADDEEEKEGNGYSTEISMRQFRNSQKYNSFFHFLRKITFGCMKNIIKRKNLFNRRVMMYLFISLKTINDWVHRVLCKSSLANVSAIK